jgi:hypothetical protein
LQTQLPSACATPLAEHVVASLCWQEVPAKPLTHWHAPLLWAAPCPEQVSASLY